MIQVTGSWERREDGIHWNGWLVRVSLKTKSYRRYILITFKTPVTNLGVTVTEKMFWITSICNLEKMKMFKNRMKLEFPVAKWLRIQCCHCCGMSVIPGVAEKKVGGVKELNVLTGRLGLGDVYYYI